MPDRGRPMIPVKGGNAWARTVAAVAGRECVAAGVAAVGFVAGILAFHRMSPTVAEVGLVMGLASGIVRYRSDVGASGLLGAALHR
jgi:hypothetical protein